MQQFKLVPMVLQQSEEQMMEKRRYENVGISEKSKQCSDEREEGEIVENDEFEDIISSDEELSMRKRIEELEARNAELEKIANISVVYNNSVDYSKKESGHKNIERYALEPIELSDVEDFESSPPPPPVYKSSKRCSKHSTHHSQENKTRRTSFSMNRKKSTDTYGSSYQRCRRKMSRSPDVTRSRDARRKRTKHIHGSNRKRERRPSHSTHSNRPIRKVTIDEELSSTTDDEQFALDRNNLRLALNRKNEDTSGSRGNLWEKLEQKKENKNILNNDRSSNIDEKKRDTITPIQVESDDSVSLEEQELRLIALQSAFMKKHKARQKRDELLKDESAYSPSDFDEVLATSISVPCSPKIGQLTTGNNMEISPIASPEIGLSDNEATVATSCTKPIDMDIANSDSDNEFPILISVNDKWLPIDKVPAQGSGPSPVRPTVIVPPSPNSPRDAKTASIEAAVPSVPAKTDEEEEEIALRALLLAKLNSPKNSKETKNDCSRVTIVKSPPAINSPSPVPATVKDDFDSSLEAESLRALLMNKMRSKPANKTESVLKEAVRRLNAQTRASDDSNDCHDFVQSPKRAKSCDILNNSEKLSLDNINTNTNKHDSDGKRNEVTKGESTQKPFTEMEVFETIPLLLKKRPQAINRAVGKEETNLISKEMVGFSTEPEAGDPSINKSSSDKSAISMEIQPGRPLIKVKSFARIPASELLSHTNTNEKLPNTQTKDVSNTSTVVKPIVEKPKVEPLTGSSISNQPVITKASKLSPKKQTKPMNEQIRASTKTSGIPTATKAVAPVIRKKSPKKTADIQKPSPTAVNQLKRKTGEISSSTLLPKKAKPSAKSRLITTTEVPKVKKLIITLGTSDTESDGEFAGHTTRSVRIENDYYDNASPMSLPMESPCYTPRSGSPALTAANDKSAGNDEQTPAVPMDTSAKKSVVNDLFEAKLDQYLRKFRTTVEKTKKDVTPSVAVTPVAVRHLPLTSQMEYRRLLNRMQILERQKQLKNSSSGESPSSDCKSVDSCPVESLKVVIRNNSEPPAGSGKDTQSEPEPSRVIITDKCKSAQPALPNVQENSEKPSNEKVIADKSKENAIKQKTELLQKYEAAYARNGSHILQQMTKTIDLVVTARQKKFQKFKLENRLAELRKEMERIESEIAVENKEIGRIYPEISRAHKSIIDLKTRRTKLDRATLNLGKIVKGTDYCLKNSDKDAIMERSRVLSLEIKSLKSLKHSDVTAEEKSPNTETKDNGVIEDEKTIAQGPIVEVECTIRNDQKQEDESLCSKSEENQTNLKIQSPPQNVQNNAILKESEELQPQIEGVTLDNTSTEESHGLNVEESADGTEKEPVSITNEQQMETPKQIVEVKESNVMEEDENTRLKANVVEYVSPLSSIIDRQEQQIDPNGVICPYELMGQCDDKDCKYVHLSSNDKCSNIPI